MATKLFPRDVELKIAALSGADWRTVRRYEAGLPVRRSTAFAIQAAMSALGLAEPRAAEVSNAPSK